MGNSGALAFSGKKLLLAGLLLALGTGCSLAQAIGPVSINLEKTTVTQGEPVLVDVRVENQSWPALDLDLGGDGKGNVLIGVKMPNGKKVWKPAPDVRAGVLVFLGGVHLQLGETYSEALVLNEWFRFEEVGTYDVQVNLKAPIRVGETILPVTSFIQHLEVRAKDPSRLTAACEDLAARVQDRRTAQDAQAAALALSYVDDVVAVRSLERVLRGPPGFEQSAASGLARIGNDDAVAALIRSLGVSDELKRSSARAALQSIASTTSDPAIRSRIGDELSRERRRPRVF